MSSSVTPALAQQEPEPTLTSPAPQSSPLKGGRPAVDIEVETAKKKARETGKRVEVPTHFNESMKVWASSDGKTLQAELHTRPIQLESTAKKGVWEPIDTTIVTKGGKLTARRVKTPLEFGGAGSTSLVSADGDNGRAGLRWAEKLPAPRVSGNQVVYPDAVAKGADLVVRAEANGFTQDIVLRQPPAGPLSVRLGMTLPKGMTYGKTADGRPQLRSAEGKPAAAPLAVQAMDARAEESPEVGKIGTVEATVENAADGSNLVLQPDSSFLADPSVTYPVTVSLASEWIGAGLAHDAWVNKNNPTLNHLTDTWLRAGTTATSADIARIYLRYIVNGTELTYATIRNADLMLWNYRSGAPAGSTKNCGLEVGSGIVARKLTSSWDPNTLSWSNQPTWTTTGQNGNKAAYSDTAGCSGGGELLHSIEQIVQSWANGEPDHGLVLMAASESATINWRQYRSQEGGTHDRTMPDHEPILFIEYEPAPKTRVAFSSDHDFTSWPTYNEAVSMQESEPDVTDQSAVTLDDSRILETNRRAAYEVGTDRLQPPDGAQWSEPDPDVQDHSPPTIVAVAPPVNATQVPPNSTVTVTFDRDVWDAAFTLKDSSGSMIDGTATMDSTNTILTFIPTQPLRGGVTYTADVRDAGDVWDNVVDPFSWSFTVAANETAHWKLDEGTGTTAADSSGHGHNATLSDTASWTQGKSGSALTNVAVPQALTQAQSNSALRDAATQGKQVEVAGITTETSVTYAQPDGKTFKTETTAGPVRTKQGAKWVPIDTALAEQGGTLRPKAIKSGAALEVSTGGTGTFVKMTAADGQTYALSWPTALPKPTVSKNVATFTDAAGKGADLVVTVLPTGFRHDVVLRERPAKPLELRIGVETGGLTLAEGKGGRLLLTSDKDKKLVASAPQPVMWDASAKGRLATGRLPQDRHAKIATDVVTTGGRTELVLKPDHAFLSDPATKYPVRVDPTTTLPFNHDVEVATTNTTEQPADPTSAVMMAGTRDGQKYRVHLRFDTAALTGATVSDAKLSLNNMDAPACGAAVGAGIQARRLTGAWDENNLYWANKPASTTEDAQINKAGINQDCAPWPGSMDWNVTGIAQDWAGGAANHGLVLQSPTETNVDNYRVFTAAEDTDFNSPPKLTVTTTGPASAPAISALAVTPAQDVAGVTTVTSLTPQLAATVADPVGGSLTGEFEIEHDPAATGQGTGQIWTGSSTAVASGTQATAAVPAGKLTDGWKVRWRARAANPAASTTSAWAAWQNATIDVPGPISEPTVGALQVNPSQVVNGTTVTSTLTPSLLAQVSDPAGGNLRAEYELEHDPTAPQGQGSGQIWTGAVDNIASGTQARLAVPAGKLTDGWLVRWRARAVAGQLPSAWADWQQVAVNVVQPGEEPLARTDGPVIRTDQSFTAAAWLRWSDKDGDYTIVEQSGTHQAPFRLGNTPDHGLIFTFTSADTTGATTQGVLSDVEPPVNEWFHLAGVYDATAKTATLYLNGNPIKTDPVGFTTWHADTAMVLGSRMLGGLDEVRIYQRALSSGDVSGLIGNSAAITVTEPSIERRITAKKEQSKATVANLPTFDYDRVKTLEDCEALRDSSNQRYSTPGWSDLRPYSGCWSKFLAYGDWTMHPTEPGKYPPVPDDGYKVEATVVMHSYLGTADGNAAVGVATRRPNQIDVWTRLDDIKGYNDGKPTDEFDSKELQLEVQVKGSDGAECRVTEGKPRRDTISKWNAHGDNTWLIESSIGEGDSHNCTIRPLLFEFGGVVWFNEARPLWGKIEFENILGNIRLPYNIQAIGIPTGSRSEFPPTVRCDKKVFSKNFLDRMHTGACIFPDANRIFTMKRSDAQINEVVSHIDKALHKPTETIPTLPPLDTQGQPQSKVMAGNIDAQKNIQVNGQTYTNPAWLWLTRAADPPGTPKLQTWSYKNRKAIGPACRAERNRLKTANQWPANVIVNGKSVPKLQCDEYPFASTQNGAADSKGHFSVQYVDKDKNEMHGKYLAAFYSRYRVGHDNRFWVRIVN